MKIEEKSLSSGQRFQDSETLTPGSRPEIWSEHDKSRQNGPILLLTKALLFKKPFREHIGITWKRKTSG